MTRGSIPFPFSYFITDGAVGAGSYDSESTRVVENARRLAEAGLSAVQIREKSLPAKLVRDLASRVVKEIRNAGTLCLVNERFDIALAAGADGVHLTSRSIPVEFVRRSTPEGFLIGVSAHSVEEVVAASRSGADFAVFGPVFSTPGKGAPVGTAVLSKAVAAADGMPVLALGGLARENFRSAMEAGAYGIAGIRLFLDAGSASSVLKALSDNGHKEH